MEISVDIVVAAAAAVAAADIVVGDGLILVVSFLVDPISFLEFEDCSSRFYRCYR